MRSSGLSAGRLAAGLLAIAGLIAMGLWLLPGWNATRVPALVEAARTFTLDSIEPGRYHWSLRDGSAARSRGLIREKHLGFERTELVELTLAPAMATGCLVQEQQELARLHSLLHERRRDELTARRQALLAHRDLLAAGGRPSEVAEAGWRVAVAQAALHKEQSVLTRLQALAAQGLASAEELETQEQLVEIRRREVALAEAGQGVVRAPQRSEALAEVDAEIAALSSELAELAALAEEGSIRSPLNGVVQVGGAGIELQVFDLTGLFLRLPVPLRHRQHLEIGAPVSFISAAVDGQILTAEVVGIAVAASSLEGHLVFWTTARLQEEHQDLQPGCTGFATIRLTRSGSGPLAWLRQLLRGVRA